MGDDNDGSWQPLTGMARFLIQQIEHGDTLVAKQVAKLAARALRGVLSGLEPDPEQRIYLDCVSKALEDTAAGIDPRKAFGVWTDSRRPSVSSNRNPMLFLLVGQEFDRLTAKSGELERPVARAIEIVAQRTGYGQPTVEKAWKDSGGEDAWRLAQKP